MIIITILYVRLYDYKTTITKSPMLVHIIWYVTPPNTIWLTAELKQLSE